MADLSELAHRWYELADPNLGFRQGDVFLSVRVLTLKYADGELLLGHLEPTGWVAMTPSCDLEQDTCEGVLLCPVKEAAISIPSSFAVKESLANQYLECVRRGIEPGKFMFPSAHELGVDFPLAIADFRVQTVVPKSYLLSITDQVVRMRPQFREKFGNWVGQSFAAVGLEVKDQIDPFSKGLYPAQKLRILDQD